MKKLILLVLATLSSTGFAQRFSDEAGVRTPSFKLVDTLRHPDEQDDFAQLVLALKNAAILKKEGAPQWTETFDKAIMFLKKIQNSKSFECRQKALQVAKDSNFEKLWKERHTIEQLVKDNGPIVGQTLFKIAVVCDSAGQIHRMFRDFKGNKGTALGCEYEGNRYFPDQPAERVQYVYTRSDNNPQALAPTSVNTSEAGKFTFTYVKVGLPSAEQIIKGSIAASGAYANADNIAQNPRTECLFFGALLLSKFFGWDNYEVTTPLVATVANATKIIVAGKSITPFLSSLWSEWGRKCPLDEMQEELEKDKTLAELYGQTEEEQQQVPLANLSTIDVTSLLKGNPVAPSSLQKKFQDLKQKDLEDSETATDKD